MYNLNKKQDDSGNAVDIDVKEGEYMRNGDVTLTWGISATEKEKGGDGAEILKHFFRGFFQLELIHEIGVIDSGVKSRVQQAFRGEL